MYSGSKSNLLVEDVTTDGEEEEEEEEERPAAISPVDIRSAIIMAM